MHKDAPRIMPVPLEEKQFGHPGQAPRFANPPMVRTAPQPDKDDRIPAPILTQILGPVNQNPHRNIWDRMIDDHASTYYDQEGHLTWAQMSFGYCTPSASRQGSVGTGMMSAAQVSGQSYPTGSIMPSMPVLPDSSARIVPPPPPVIPSVPVPPAPVAPAAAAAPAPAADPDAREPAPDYDEDSQPEEQPQNPGGN